MKTDIQLQSPGLAECQALISAGWKVDFAGTGMTLDVWLTAPDIAEKGEAGNIIGVDPSLFRQLRAFEREVVEATKQNTPPAPPPVQHVFTTDSKAIFSFGYDPNAQAFEIIYKSSPQTVYIRHNVPAQVFEDARKAASIGTFIAKTFHKTCPYPETRRPNAMYTGIQQGDAA